MENDKTSKQNRAAVDQVATILFVYRGLRTTENLPRIQTVMLGMADIEVRWDHSGTG